MYCDKKFTFDTESWLLAELQDTFTFDDNRCITSGLAMSPGIFPKTHLTDYYGPMTMKCHHLMNIAIMKEKKMVLKCCLGAEQSRVGRVTLSIACESFTNGMHVLPYTNRPRCREWNKCKWSTFLLLHHSSRRSAEKNLEANDVPKCHR